MSKELIDLLIRAADILDNHIGNAYCQIGDIIEEDIINEINSNPAVINRKNELINIAKQTENEESKKRHCIFCRKLLKTIEGKHQHENVCSKKPQETK